MASFRNSLNVVRSVRAAAPRFSQMLSRPAVRAYSTGGQAPNDTKQGGFGGVVPVVTLAAVAGVAYLSHHRVLLAPQPRSRNQFRPRRLVI